MAHSDKKRARERRVSPFAAAAMAGGGMLALAWLLLFLSGREGGLSARRVGGGILLVYLLLLAVLLIVHLATRSRRREAGEQMLAGGLPILRRMPMPVGVFRDDGTVIFANEALQSLSDGKLRPRGRVRLAQVLPEAGVLLSGQEGEAGAREVILFGAPFLATPFRIALRGGEKPLAILFEDRGPILALREEKEACNPVVLSLAIDNLDDILRLTGDTRRLPAAIADVVSRFSEELEGILEEQERDKFLILFTEDKLSSLLAGRFDVLDRLAEVDTGERSPVTITASIGVSGKSGSLAARVAEADAALAGAQQDGGACALVRGDDGSYVKYGGNSKAVQSSSKVRARMAGEQLLSQLESADKLIVMGHATPDYDSFGASVGVAVLARARNLPVYLVTGNANFNIRRAIALLDKIDWLRGRILTPLEAMEKLTPRTLLVTVDTSNPRRFAAPDLAGAAARTVIIDHHRRGEELSPPPVLSYIDPSASSACEMVCEMLEALLPKGFLRAREADLLLAGILLDTKNFTVGAGPRAFGAAQYLKGVGADPARVQENLLSSEMSAMRREASFEQGAALYREGVVISVNRDEKILPSEESIGSRAADYLLTARGVEASFVLFRIGGTVHIKARSRGRVNVQAIMSSIGGGGRFDAAAHAMEDTPLSDAERRVKRAVDAYFGQM